MANIALMVAAEYAAHIVASKSDDPHRMLLSIAEEVKMMREAMNGQMPEWGPPDPSLLYIEFAVTLPADLEKEASECAVGIVVPGQSDDETYKQIPIKEADKLIAVCVPMLLYMVCHNSGLGFEKALKTEIDAILGSYHTIFTRPE